MNYDECDKSRDCKHFDTYTCLFCRGFVGTDTTQDYYEALRE